MFNAYVPTARFPITVESWKALSYVAPGEVLRPYGRPDPVAVTDVRSYPSGTLVLITPDAPTRELLTALLAPGDVVGFHPGDPAYGLPDPVYLRVGKASMSRVSKLAWVPDRRWTLDAQVVDNPMVVTP